jgi:ABC-type sugar transport system substrate-binding protein
MFKSLILALALALIPPGPATAAEGRKVHLGLAVHSLGNGYWEQEIKGGRLFADSLPAGSIVTQILTCDGDDKKQIAIIRAFIAEHGRDAILFVDPSSAANTTAISVLCEESGVYWTSVRRRAKGLSPLDFRYYVMHQSVDGLKQGYDTAVRLFKEFKNPGRGRILALLGPGDSNSAMERYEGLEMALSEYGEVELLDTAACDWNPQAAQAATEAWLKKSTDFDGIWSASDDLALAAIPALRARGLNGAIKVSGVDGAPAALEAIETGDLVCTAAANGHLQGGYGAAYAYKAWSGEIRPDLMPSRQRAFYTDSVLVDLAGLDGYRRLIQNPPAYDYDNLEFPIGRAMKLESTDL